MLWYNNGMSVITPSSNVKLLKCPLEMDNNHQLTFASKQAQYNYFNGLPSRTLDDDFTYVRETAVIRIDADIDEIRQYNYLMYQNEAYSNKWFYAFIVDMEYLNDSCTAVMIKLDTWQTWQFDLTFRKCYVEREHVNDDTVGIHTVPEGLDYGPSYVCADRMNYKYADPTSGNVIALFQVTTTSIKVGNNTITFPTPTYNIVNGLPQGCAVFGIPLNKNAGIFIPAVCNLYDAAGKGDAIVAISLVPRDCAEWENKSATNWPYETNPFVVPTYSTASRTLPLLFPDYRAPTTLDGYTPKNNKMFTSPYTYFYLSNNAGVDVTYRFEDFYSNKPYFTIKGSLEQGGAIYALPNNSKANAPGIGDGYNEGVPGIKLPNLSWLSDYYLNWQAVNGKNVAIQTGLDAINWGLNIASDMQDSAATALSGITSFASRTANTAQQVRQAQMTPPQAKGNAYNGTLAFTNGECRFTWRKMTIKAEYAKIIDDYFTMYGYKVNSLKVPNITGRSNWNYVKTIDVNIIGDVPQDDIAEIKSYFDRGITLWHNANTFLDYNQNNNIV